MQELLKKTRRLNKQIQNFGSDDVSFLELSRVLREILKANVYITSRKGKILGHDFVEGFDCEAVEKEIIDKGRFPEAYNDALLEFKETNENMDGLEYCVFDKSLTCEYPNKISTVIPISSTGDRLGTLLLARFGERFTEEDLILAEYSATIVGMEILRSKSNEIEEEARKKSVVQMALGTLSYSELEAMDHIFEELDGDEGLLVASKVADRVGITRSVIVNALRKFESAGVIESRSLGMKGTHIKILNDKLMEELKKARE